MIFDFNLVFETELPMDEMQVVEALIDAIMELDPTTHIVISPNTNNNESV